MEAFKQRKSQILQDLHQNLDNSPKGSIDEHIRDLVDYINRHPSDSFVTTSSCSGRVSVYTTRRCDIPSRKGVQWLIVKHTQITIEEVDKVVEEVSYQELEHQCVFLKFEPFLLHVLCRDMEVGRELLEIAMNCGMRESGLVVGRETKGERKVMVHIRSTSLILESLLLGGSCVQIGEGLLEEMVREVNGRFEANFLKLHLFSQALKSKFSPPPTSFSCNHIPIHGVGMAGCDFEGGICLFGGRRGSSLQTLSLFRTLEDFHNIESLPVLPTPHELEEISFSAICALEEIDCLVVFGGEKSGRALGGLWQFSISSLSWSDIPILSTTQLPSPRWGHSLTKISPNCLLLVGGRDGSGGVGDQVYLLKAVDGEIIWSTIDFPSDFSPRYFHTAAHTSMGTFILGGYGSNQLQEPILGDIWLVDDDQLSFRKLEFPFDVSVISRASSSLLLLQDTHQTITLLLWGGICEQDGFFHDPVIIKICKGTLEVEIVSDNFEENSIASILRNKKEDLRAHSFLSSFSDGSIVSLGGGMPLFGFKFHYSPSFIISRGKFEVIEEEKRNDEREEEEVSCLIVPSHLTKRFKTALETLNLLNKRWRICNFQDEGLLLEGGILLNSPQLSNVESKEETKEDGFSKSLKLIPLSCSISRVKKDLNEILESEREEEVFGLVDVDCCEYCNQKKAVIVNPKEKLYNSLIGRGVDQNSTRFLTSCKYEILGKNLLLLPHNFEEAMSDSNLLEKRDEIYDSLLCSFGVERIGQSAPIVRDGKRSSQARLVVPPLGQPDETGKGSQGWVQVREGGVTFEFDFTRVMFCSGNVTERMRMGEVDARGEVIADLFCGIGYYSIPLLLHGQAQHVHSFEWNPHSILGFKSSLRASNIPLSRVTIHEGDNRESVPSLPTLHFADRVILGLLPTSQNHWDLVPYLLKMEGGVVHIHDNVAQEDVGDRVAFALQSFSQLFPSNSCSVIHVEKVKWYAPLILHIVIDISIT